MRQIASIKRAAGHDFSHRAQVNPVLKKPAGKFYLLDLILKAGTGGGNASKALNKPFHAMAVDHAANNFQILFMAFADRPVGIFAVI